MSLFVGLGLLSLGMVLVLWLPLRRPLPEQEDTEDFRDEDIAIYRERLAELEADRARGLIDEARLAELQTELQRRLLSEVPEQTGAALQAGRPPWLLSLTISVLLIPLAVVLYEQLGARKDLALSEDLQRVAASEDQQQQAGALQDLVTGLAKRVEEEPDNLENRYLLARSYLELRRTDAALAQYQELLRRSPQPEPRIMAEYAQLSFFANDRRLDDQVRELLDETLALEPDNSVALGVLGIDAYEQGRFAEAVAYWERVLVQTEPGPGREALERGIASARSRLNPSAPAVAQPPSADEDTGQAGGAELRVLVELEPSLRARLTGSEAVFVFARDPQGPPMPLAVARLSVAQLPSLVRLNDSMAMMPTAKLSQARQVRLQARVSLSGQPQGDSGDLQAQPLDVVVQEVDGVLRLLIDQVIP